MSLREAWDTSFPEVAMLISFEEDERNGGREWLADAKKRMGIAE